MKTTPLQDEIVRSIFAASRPTSRRRTALRRRLLACTRWLTTRILRLYNTLTADGEIHPAPWILIGMLLAFLIQLIHPLM